MLPGVGRPLLAVWKAMALTGVEMSGCDGADIDRVLREVATVKMRYAQIVV